MPEHETICGYGLADVRKSLCAAVDRRERRAAHRWTAELVTTPGAVGSLWAAYWVAWAAAQGAGSASPTIPIILKQSWDSISELAAEHIHAGDGWPAFRNDQRVRAMTTEMTARLINQARQTPVIWPSKEITQHDIATARETAPPPQADGPIVMRVWIRDEDHMELRMAAGRFIDAIERGELRQALSVVAWTLLPPVHQKLPVPLKIGVRGPVALAPKQRASAIWFWLELGRALLLARPNLHRGWVTLHNAIAEAFRLHYKRWTAAERMRILLAWILQLRASYSSQPESLWSAPPMTHTTHDIDLPYKEIAAELSNPNTPIIRNDKAPEPEKESKRAAAARIEAQLQEADSAILAAMGLTEDDL
jgi:hypothetical protein